LLPQASQLSRTTLRAQSTSDANQSFISKYEKPVTSSGHRNALRILAGNRDGTGTALEFDHFFAIGAKIAPDMSVKITQPVAQFIDESRKK